MAGPLETIAFCFVFEFRGKFFEKYVRRFQKKARKQRTLKAGMRGAETGMKGVMKGVEKGVQKGVESGLTSTRKINGMTRSIDHSPDRESAGQGYDAEEGEYMASQQAQAARLVNNTAALVRAKHGMMYMAMMRFVRNGSKFYATVVLIPVALTAWVPLYFVENFISSWRRRSGEREIQPSGLYLLSLTWCVLLVAPFVIFSHVVTDRLPAEYFSKIAYGYLFVVYAAILYGFWITRWDPTMATIPDPRPNNRVRGNWFEGTMGYGILVYLLRS